MPSLSQKYRPRLFAEVTGQRHVTETLRKEVATNTLGHAYLFCGPRGVGKTTAARIFAKALNCEQPQDGEPCNVCASCLAANAGKHMDIIEMDAATHTGVDNVREAIIEHVRFGPSQGKRKIYILDEAHMLSGSSWNALLKTLEEPPAYAFFILATTEWHKVPTTIVSRCQRFEFKRISDKDLGARVRETAKKEGWTIDDDVVALILSRSDGCARDAETLLGQVGSLGETHLDMGMANLVIPPNHRSVAAHLIRLWADRKHIEALQEVQRLFDDGIPVLPLFDDLLFISRRLLLAPAEPELVEQWKHGTDDERLSVDLVGRFLPMELNDLSLLLLERRRDIKGGVDPLFALQLVSTVAANGLLRYAQEHRQERSDVDDPPRPPLVSEKEAPLVAPPSQNHGQADTVAPVSKERPSTPEEPAPLVEVSPSESSSTNDAPLDLHIVRGKWNAFVRAVDEKNHSLPFILKISRPESVEGTRLTIRFQYPFHRDKILADVKHLRVVEECARDIFLCPTLKLDGIVGEDPAQKEARSQDMVGTILKAFGGQVVE